VGVLATTAKFNLGGRHSYSLARAAFAVIVKMAGLDEQLEEAVGILEMEM
jgi:hypothetical protein